MNGNPARQRNVGSIFELLLTLADVDGTAGHGHASANGMGQGGDLTRNLPNLADAVHFLCMLHGRHPGVIDHAAMRTTDNGARSWLIQAADGFTAERTYLTQLAVVAGPAPSTAGQGDTEAAVVAQRHALDMLAQSDRRGCAMGAAFALALDWIAIRRILDAAALRLGLSPRRTALPDRHETLTVASTICEDESIERAVHFGARQLLGQHRGLWDLLSARALARQID
ncbi:MAG: hypothetical protein JJE34_03000 [Alphaproteobacteria bacterium]|nr:hypothetical protein [Alphaproteobacteria bacterium]